MQKIEWQFTTSSGLIVTQYKNPDAFIIRDPSDKWHPSEFEKIVITDLAKDLAAANYIIDAFTKSQRPAGPDYSVSHPADGT
jgi:hypothetical protein